MRLSVRLLHPQYLENEGSLESPFLLSLLLFLLFVVSLCVCPCSAASTDLVEKSQAAQKLLKVVIAGLSEDAHSEEVRKVCKPSSFFFYSPPLSSSSSSSSSSCSSLLCHESSSMVFLAKSLLLICCHTASVPFCFCEQCVYRKHCSDSFGFTASESCSGS